VTDTDDPSTVDGVDGVDSADGTDNTESDHDHTDVRYLDAKASVDDRAFSRRVRDQLIAALPAAPTVFDAACGTGVALDRLREWGVEPAAYRGVDTASEVIRVARDRHSESAVEFATGDAITVAERIAAGDDRVAAADGLSADEPITKPDLVVAGCFLDLVPVEEALDAFTAATVSDGLVYAPFSFDGTTEFTPSHRADDLVTEIFHGEIDAHDGRDSGAGRAAVDYCRRADGQLLAVDAADWVVRPTADGEYPNDEQYFLATILGYVADALFVDGGDAHTAADADGHTVADAGDAAENWEPTARAVTALDDTDLAVADLRDWLQTRRRQLADGELVYLAHQLDVLYQTS
jgi:SAM-dependent methyltransferase